MRRIQLLTLVFTRHTSYRRGNGETSLIPILEGLTERMSSDILSTIHVSLIFDLTVPVGTNQASLSIADLIDSPSGQQIVLVGYDSNGFGGIGDTSTILKTSILITPEERDAILAQWRPWAELSAWTGRHHAAEKKAGLDKETYERELRKAIREARILAEARVRGEFGEKYEAFETAFRAQDPHPGDK